MTEAKKPVTLLDLDTLLDTKVNAVETIPDYVNPPAGDYTLVCKEAKIDKYKDKETTEDRLRFKLTIAVKTTHQIAPDQEDNLPVPEGTLFTQTFQGTDDGMKYFKKAMMNITGVTDFEDASFRDVMESVKDVEFSARLTYRTTKDDKTGKEYKNLNMRTLKNGVEQPE